MTDTKPTQGRDSEPGNYFVARTEEEFWQGLMSGEVFEASEKLPAKAGFYPEGGEHVVSEEEFYAPRKPLLEGESHGLGVNRITSSRTLHLAGAVAFQRSGQPPVRPLLSS